MGLDNKTKPDSLTRRPGDLLGRGDDERVLHQQQIVLKPHKLGNGVPPAGNEKRDAALKLAALVLEEDTPIHELVTQRLKGDLMLQAVIRSVQGGDEKFASTTIAESPKLSRVS